MPQNLSRDGADLQVQLTDAQKDLVLQALESELGGVQVYTQALKCAQNAELEDEWTKYLTQTRIHVEVALALCKQLGLDPDEMTPGRAALRHIGESLVAAMKLAADGRSLVSAELVAAECVTLAETKDHANWELLQGLAEELEGSESPLTQILQHSCDRVERDEDEHLYHSAGWSRELWKQALGMTAVLPPPE
jgi:hypothetical protein